jgi:hypothetical protein
VDTDEEKQKLVQSLDFIDQLELTNLVIEYFHQRERSAAMFAIDQLLVGFRSSSSSSSSACFAIDLQLDKVKQDNEWCVKQVFLLSSYLKFFLNVLFDFKAILQFR